MKVTFTKSALVRRASDRISARRGLLGPTASAVRAFLNLCGGAGEDITYEVGSGTPLPDEVWMDDLLGIIGERVRVYVCLGTFVGDMLQEELSRLAGERRHREFEVMGVKCYNNNGVLHLTTSIRDGRIGTLHESRTLWNVTGGDRAVNVSDRFVGDCISEGGMDAPLTRWYAGAYPKGDYCTISNIAAYGTDEKE